MVKTGKLTSGVSPCGVCGKPSSVITGGQAFCHQHAARAKKIQQSGK